MTPLVGPADLLRVLASLPRDEAREAAETMGYVWRAPTPEVPPPPPEEPPPPPPREPTPQERFEEAVARLKEQRARQPDAARFWRVERFEPRPETEPDSSPAEGADGPLLPTEQGGDLFATPSPSPLAPWRHLWRTFYEALRSDVPTRDPDAVALVHRWSRGQPVLHIPHKRRPAWASRAALWIDASPRLIPLRYDQELVLRALQRVFKRALTVRWMGQEATWQARQSPRGWLEGQRLDTATPIVVLGDLGRLVSKDAEARWSRALSGLHRRGVRATAVVPWSVRRRSGGTGCAVRSWHPHASSRQRSPEDAAAQLLALVSAASVVQPGLLRSLRRLVPGATLETELRVWNDPAVSSADITGMMLRRNGLAEHRHRFGTLPDSLQRAAIAAIRAWHEKMPRELVHAETLLLEHALHAPVSEDERKAALAFVQRLGETLADSLKANHASWCRYGRILRDLLPRSASREVPALRRLSAALGDPPAWALRQVGDALFVSLRDDLRWPSDATGPGSPVAVLEAAGAEVFVNHGGPETQRVLAAGLSLPLPAGASVSVREVRGTQHLAPWAREPWATAAGRDAYGLWAEVTVAGVAFRMRWIPPGRFVMGSPENEAGRFGNEGPQHTVVLTQGFWLGETPVTQALWWAVMRDNPSRFKDDARPVETVTWFHCQTFVKRVNEMVAGLDLRLPREHEWEYTCRAGIQEPTWLGANDRNRLGRIAWYSGSAGNRTQPVGAKEANPFGLYDMLGNVWEWCEDWLAGYDAVAVVDPPLAQTGIGRVIRGGSWLYGARIVRAALRVGYSPDARLDGLGFRLARGPSAPGVASGQGGSPKGGEAEPTPGEGGRRGRGSGKAPPTRR